MSHNVGDEDETTVRTPHQLPFPPLKRSHVIHCSYHYWHPRFRGVTPKARLIPLPESFLRYLREDGIILPQDDADTAEWSDSDSGIFSGADNEADEAADAHDPSIHWRETHEAVERVIEELGGKVAPKLNWSAPKDATWIAATNSMECRTPNDVYLLLKSSDFVTHDLQHAMDETDQESRPTEAEASIPYHLVLRKWLILNPSVEFRCFVRNRRIIALCQRDLNYFDFLFQMQGQLHQKIQDFFESRIRDEFPDPDFVFDVYIPPPHDRVWLIDFNPWAQRTDPLLFSWLELLTLPESADPMPTVASGESTRQAGSMSENDDQVTAIEQAEFRLVRRDDPEAYGFATPQYSAHKLPRDVVDASRGGEVNLREFANQWKEAQRLAEQQRDEASDTE